MSELARLAGAVGCAGLAAAPPRDAAGPAARRPRRLGVSAPPAWRSISRRTGAKPSCCGRGVARSLSPWRGGAAVLLRWPWALAARDARVRPDPDPGRRSAARRRTCCCRSTLVIGSLALALGWSSCAATSARASSAPLALPLAALVAWTGLSLLWTDDLARRARSSCSRSCSHSGCSRSASRGCRGAAGGCSRSSAASSRPRSSYAGSRPLPVGDARRLLEPEA